MEPRIGRRLKIREPLCLPMDKEVTIFCKFFTKLTYEAAPEWLCI